MNWTIEFVPLNMEADAAGAGNAVLASEDTSAGTEGAAADSEDTLNAAEEGETDAEDAVIAAEEGETGAEDAVIAVEDAVTDADTLTGNETTGETLIEEEVCWLRTDVTLPAWGVSLLILVLTLMTAAVIALIVQRVLKHSGKVPESAAASMVINAPPTVGKLHSQGARSAQQDCFSVSSPDLYASHGLLAVVADGMGGLEDGDQVSQTAVSAMMDGFYSRQDTDPALTLLSLLHSANGAVNRLLGFERIGMCGSTVAAGLLKEGKFYFISVGDSRICLYRDGHLNQLNRGHAYIRDLELRAVNGEGTLEEARTHPRAAGLTSFLGMGQLQYVDQPDAPVTVCPGDRFLLMSDGVYNALKEEEICQALALKDAQQAADALARAVEEKAWPGQDNYTAVILGC